MFTPFNCIKPDTKSFHIRSWFPCNSTSQATFSTQRHWHFIVMVNGLKSPKGSNNLAVNWSSDLLVACILFADLISSVKSNDISSVAVFQKMPRVLTGASAVRVGPTVDLIKDLSSPSTTAFGFSVFAYATVSSLLLMSWSSSREFEFHFRKLKVLFTSSSFDSW